MAATIRTDGATAAAKLLLDTVGWEKSARVRASPRT